MKRRYLFLFFTFTILIALLIFFFQQSEKSSDLTLYGNVDVRQVDLGFRANGRVISMPFEEGDLVQQGTLMAQLDEQPYLDQMRQAQATIESTKVNLANAKKLLQRRKELISSGSVSHEDLDNAQTSYDVLTANLQQSEAALGIAITNYRDIKIYAPVDGIILTRIREPGTVVREADPIYTLSILSPVWIRAYISEPYLGVVYPGMPAEIFTDTSNGKIYKGYVGFISPVAEFTPKTVETTQLRTDLVYRLRIIAENPDMGLRQGMPVTVKLHHEIP